MQQPSPKTEAIPFFWPFKRVFYGWAVVGTSVLASFAQVPMYGPVLSVFVKPIGDDMGWSRGEISLAFTIGSLFGALASSLAGRQLDRYGARAAIVVTGMIITGVLIGLTLVQEVWQFWLFYGLGRTAALAGITLGTSVAVSNWFIRKRGRAVSFIGIGLRTGQAVFPLFITPIILALSWRHAYGALAVVSLVLIVAPAWLFIRRRPEDMGLLPDGEGPGLRNGNAARGMERPGGAEGVAEEESWTLAEARQTLAFWLLTIAMMMVIFAQTAVNLHAIPSLLDRGMGEGFAGVFVFLFAGTAAASAFGWGMLMDRFHVRWGTILATVLFGASLLVLVFADSMPLAVLFALLFGLGTGGWTLSQTLLFANYFGRRHVGSIRGVAQMMGGPVGAAGPLVAGYIHDFTGSYMVSFQLFFVAFAVVATALFLAKPPRKAKA